MVISYFPNWICCGVREFAAYSDPGLSPLLPDNIGVLCPRLESCAVPPFAGVLGVVAVAQLLLGLLSLLLGVIKLLLSCWWLLLAAVVVVELLGEVS